MLSVNPLDSWLLGAHLIGVVFWISGLMAVYWLLRMHVHAPQDMRDKLVLMERALALSMDLAATLAIGAGLALAIHEKLFSQPKMGWLHIKITVVVLGIVSMHGMVRAKVAKFSRGEKPTVPTWIWSVLVGSVVAVILIVTRVKLAFLLSK